MIKKITSFLALFLLLGYITFGVVMANREYNRMTCERIRIVILDTVSTPILSADDVLNCIRQAKLNPIDKSYQSISLDKIEAAIEKNPIVKKAECMKTPSRAIRIRVEQRKPFLRVIDMEGGYYLDKDMIRIPTSTHFSLLLPTISGEISKTFFTQQLIPFVEHLEKDKYWRDNIQQICIEEGNRVGFIPSIGDFYVELGQLDEYKDKLSKFQLFCEKVLPAVGWDRYSRIDLQFNKQVVCKNRFERPKAIGEGVEDQ